MARAIGPCLVKVNNIYELDATGGSWDINQVVAEHATGGGWEHGVGIPKASGRIEEIIPRQGATAWRTLRDFTLEFCERDTKTIIATFHKCNWETIGGNTDTAQANTKKTIGWKSADPVEY